MPRMMARHARKAVFAVCLIAAGAPFVVAQDAQQVLRLSVGFRTARNSVTMDPEKQAAVDALAKQAQAANQAHNYGEALKCYYHGLALMRGEQWNALSALSAGLAVRLEKAVLEPGQRVGLKLSLLFVPDDKLNDGLTGSVELLAMDKDESLKSILALGEIGQGFLAHPPADEIATPEVPDGNYRIALVLRPPSGKPVVKAAAVHIERGLTSRMDADKARLAKLKSNLGSSSKSKVEGAFASIEYRLRLSEYANAGDASPVRTNFAQELKDAEEMLAAAESGRDPFETRRGDFRKAYLSTVDNTLQPYRMFVPSAYDAAKTFPLIVALHGMGGDENSYFEAYGNGAFKVEAEKRGYLVACPKGRKPASMYLGSAEQDVLDVIKEVSRAYRVDPNRIYLTGHSMGGFGTWSIAMDHPELFAALAPVSGGGSPAQVSKIAQIPQLVVHGNSDKTVPVESSRAMVEALRKAGAEVKFVEVPNGSHGSVVAPTFKDVFDWFDAHARKLARAQTAGSGERN